MAKKKTYRFFLYLFVRALAGLFSLLPRKFALACVRLFARLGYRLVGRQRQKTFDNLKTAFGDTKSDEELHQIGKRVFENVGQTSIELLHFPKIAKRDIADFVDMSEGVKLYKELLREGKGILSMTAHIGNWELLAGAYSQAGFSGAVVARKIYYEPYNKWVVNLRQALGVPTLYREEASRKVLKLLKQNQIVGMLPDQDIASLDGIFVDFLGKPAYTIVAPIKIALVTRSPIVLNFLVRVRGDQYKLVIGKVLRPEVETTKEAAIEKYTKLWMNEFERVIREYPEQWAWMHNRWKTEPQSKASNETPVVLNS